MPLYVLHLRERDHLVQDVEGTPFADLQSARTEARQAIRDIVAEHLESGEEVRLRTVEICDDQGNHVATVSLAAAISAVIPVSEDTFETDLSNYLDSDAARCSDIVNR